MFIIGCKTSSNEKLFKNIQWISFEWKPAYTGQDTLKYGSMELITKIKGLKTTTSMQFDLGATNTVIYENPLRLIVQDSVKYPFQVNWEKKGKFAGIESYDIKDLNITSSNYLFESLKPHLLKNYGTRKRRTPQHIGTIGLDAFKNKCLVINYKDLKIGITDSLSKNKLKNIDFVNFEKTKISQTVIKINIDNKPYKVLFDTGSSSWTIVTGENKFNEILGSIKNKIDSVQVSSWGKKDYFYKAPLDKTISIGSKEINTNYGYFFKENPTSKYLYDNDILAVIGNRMFIENRNTVVIDYKNKKFGIVK